MKIHQLAIEEALRSLQSGPRGLELSEAQRRLAEYGPNEVEQIQCEPLVLRFVKEFGHFFAIILWIAAALAFVGEYQKPGEGMATLGFAIIGVIVINGLFSFSQAYRAEKAVEALQKLLPHATKVVRAGELRSVPAAELVPGDLIVLEAGDNVPADSRVIEAFGVRVNNATITGESLPHSRDADPCDEADFMQSRNALLAGTSLVSGEAKALVFATGAHTAFGKIAHLTQTVGEPLSPLQREIVRLSRLVALLALGPGVFFFFIGETIGLSFWENLTFAIGIIVALVPEGLLPEVTLALALAVKRMARHQALIRHLPAVETLGSATVICTDKTGTLTENQMAVRRVFAGGSFYESGAPKLVEEYRYLLECAWLCEDVKHAAGDILLGDPMEVALFGMARAALGNESEFSRVDELPFDAKRKRLSTLHDTAKGLVLYTKGAPETVLACCCEVIIDGEVNSMTSELQRLFVDAQEQMAGNGLRVLALAHRPVLPGYSRDHLEEELVLDGLVGFEDPPRPEVASAIQKCQEAGIKVIMVTGDHPQTALAIAREVGLVKSRTPVVLTGEQLHRLSNTQLQLALDAPEILFARVAADQKMRIVTALKRKRNIVAVTGDGVNDAPALKRADIGIAMGISGTDVAREAADMILLDDNFASIVWAIEEGRTVFANIRKFLTYVLASNVAELVPFVAFALFKIPLALTIIQVLAIDLGTDLIPALGLGAEPPHPQVMRRPPRARTERLLNCALISRAYLFLGVLEGGVAMAAFFYVLHQGNWHGGRELARQDPLYLQATTACLSAIIVSQIVNVFLCRSSWESVFKLNPFGNRLLLFGVIVEVGLILLIVYTPLGNAIYGTAAISAKTWLFIAPFGIAMLGLEELRKRLVRLRIKPSGADYRSCTSRERQPSRFGSRTNSRLTD
jgi:calcium-translocating P-type ATPase